MAEVYSFESLKQKRMERDVFERWMQFYREQPYEELLESLVFEHENDFPLRRSHDWMDQLRHRALVDVCDQKAQTQFLKSFLSEIRIQSTN
ncbi:MAG: hypothetical protein ABIR96_12150 [Bdellovibrionota bacterium]